MQVEICRSAWIGSIWADPGRDAAEFGRSFVGYTTRLGYAPVMRATGRHFRDFLAGIDNLHETMRFSYPRMISPSFYISAEDERGCSLHYRYQHRCCCCCCCCCFTTKRKMRSIEYQFWLG